ncbi:MAG TPA: methyltransferase domain-containing protein [Actinopolymorphaceae bacterium]|jgi:SAM-dependent methyltransferase
MVDVSSAAREAFADETAYRQQREIYQNTTGPQAPDVLLDLVTAEAPGRLLDLGSGEGELSATLHQRGWDTFPIDFSPRMAVIAREKSLPATVQDVRALGVREQCADYAVAAWVLHYLDGDGIDRALAEIHRALRPGGVFFAATHSTTHLKQLWDRLPGVTYQLTFSAENGGEILSRMFARVERIMVQGDVTVPDYEWARRFLANQLRPPSAARRLRRFSGSLHATRCSAVFRAVRAG